MATMKAVRVSSFGGPEVMREEPVPVPEPGTGELLVRVYAASVNPVDYKTSTGQYPPVTEDDLPIILGRDIAGRVEVCGSGVGDFTPGDDVYALLPNNRGAFTEQVAIPAETAASKPDTLDYVHAAAVPLAGLTAWQGLFDYGELQAGQRVLIHGGGGGVGHYAVQFAKVRGAEVIATASGDDLEFVRELGADRVIDYHEQFEAQVSDVDLVLDLVGGETQQRSWQVLKPGGVMVSTLGEPADADERDAEGIGFLVQPNGRELAEIARLIDEGRVRVTVQETFPLDRVPDAEQRLRDSHVRGKLVIKVA